MPSYTYIHTYIHTYLNTYMHTSCIRLESSWFLLLKLQCPATVGPEISPSRHLMCFGRRSQMHCRKDTCEDCLKIAILWVLQSWFRLQYGSLSTFFHGHLGQHPCDIVKHSGGRGLAQKAPLKKPWAFILLTFGVRHRSRY